MDLKIVIERILKVKSKYPAFKFIQLKKTMSEDRYPPNNYYSYSYIDSITGLTMKD